MVGDGGWLEGKDNMADLLPAMRTGRIVEVSSVSLVSLRVDRL